MFPKVHIYVDPQQFTFENPRGENLILKTVVRVNESKDGWKVANVGVDTSEDQPSGTVAIDLFENQRSVPDGINKGELLGAFLWFGVVKSLQYRSSFLPTPSPKIIFHGTGCLADMLCGYEKAILHQAAEQVTSHIVFE